MAALGTTTTTTAAATGPAAATDALWQVHLLGGFALDDGEQRLTRLRSRAAMLLLARVAMAPSRDHAREELAGLLWPEAGQAASRSRLRQTLSYLKSMLEPPGGATVLIADRRVVRVAPNTLWCDVAAFEDALRGGRRGDAGAHYRGELLPGFYDEWVHDERQRLQALADRVGDASPGAAAFPAAPQATARGTLTRMVPTPVAGAAPAREQRLPQYLTRLIGADLTGARLRDIVREHRLVTVLGPGGSGKTRLAVEVARLLADAASGAAPVPAFERALFVSLVECVDAVQLLDRMALALRLGAAGDVFATLLGALDGQRLLIVLDNAEQLGDDAAARIAALAEQLPLAHWLVTSRRPLGLDGEREFMLDALELPVTGAPLNEAALSPAVALFVDRARAHRVEFHVTAGNCEALVALVQWLGGLPLAIELAASRSRTLGPAEMLALLRAAVAEPRTGSSALAWLSRRGARSGDDARHASMLAVVEWSWTLLTAGQRRLLQAVCAQPAGVDVGAAAAIAAAAAGAGAGTAGADVLTATAPLADVQASLDALVAHSVVQVRSGQDGRARYQATEPVRHYVVARLDDVAARAMRAAVLAHAVAWAAAMPSTPPLATVREELPNLLAVLADAVADERSADAVRLILSLQSSWAEIAIPAGALDLLARILATPGLAPELLAAGHAIAAWSAFDAGQRDAALMHAAAALVPTVADAAVRASVLSRVARVRWRIDRDAAATRLRIAEALPLARQNGRMNTEAALLSLEGHIAGLVDGDSARAAALSRQALELWSASGNEHLVNAGRYNVAVSASLGGRHDDALADLRPLAEAGLALHDWDLAAGALDAAGTALMALRRWAEAAQAQRAGLLLAWDTMEVKAVVFALWNAAHSLARLRRPESAAETMGFVVPYWLERFGELDDSDRRDVRRVRRFVRAQLPAAEAAAAWERGRRRTLADAVHGVLAAI